MNIIKKHYVYLILIITITSIFTITGYFLGTNITDKIEISTNETVSSITKSISILRLDVYNTINEIITIHQDQIRQIGKYISQEYFRSITHINLNPFFKSIQNIRFSPIIYKDELETYNSFGNSNIVNGFTIKSVGQLSGQPSDSYFINQSFHIPIANSDPVFFPPGSFGLDLYNLSSTKNQFFDKITSTEQFYLSSGIRFGASRDEFDLGLYIGKIITTGNCTIIDNNFYDIINNNRGCIYGVSYVPYFVRDVMNASLERIALLLPDKNTNIKFVVYDITNNIIIYRDSQLSEFTSPNDIQKILGNKFIRYSELNEAEPFKINSTKIITYIFFTKDIEDNSLKMELKMVKILIPILWLVSITIATIIYYLIFRNMYHIHFMYDELNTMVRYVNHEIRNQLAAICQYISLTKTYLDLILQKKIECNSETMEKVNRSLISSLNIIKTLSIIVGDVMDVQELELSNNPNIFTLKTLKENILSSMEYKIDENISTIEFKVNTFDDNFVMYSDINRIEQILKNYIFNAYKATNSGHIHVNMYRNTDKLIICVEDTGSGIKNELSGQLFNKKFTKSNFATSIRNTGIGLFLCKKIANAINAKVYFTTEINKGSNFYLEFDINNIKAPINETTV